MSVGVQEDSLPGLAGNQLHRAIAIRLKRCEGRPLS